MSRVDTNRFLKEYEQEVDEIIATCRGDLRTPSARTRPLLVRWKIRSNLAGSKGLVRKDFVEVSPPIQDANDFSDAVIYAIEHDMRARCYWSQAWPNLVSSETGKRIGFEQGAHFENATDNPVGSVPTGSFQIVVPDCWKIGASSGIPLVVLAEKFFDVEGMGTNPKADLTLPPGEQPISEEAVKTSEIEGEILNRDSVKSSLRAQLGLGAEAPNVKPAERGISKMMLDLYRNYAAPLTDRTMFDWHTMLLTGDKEIKVIGGYRTRADAMQVVSGPIHKRTVHFEAPPSARVPEEMERFIAWFNDTAPGGKTALQALTRAALVHLYFVCIHPFEDGNDRIGRALAEKALAQNLGQPTLIALAYTIERKRKDYYAAQERNNKELHIDGWMKYFANTVLQAEDNTIKRVDFYIAKAKFYEQFRDQLNERQAKVVARMFREGIDGFTGGLSAENYIRISKTSRATATRDLQDLVEKGALTKTGELRHTRYSLKLPIQEPGTQNALSY